MTTNFNECLYLNAEKDNAGSMLKKCINGSDELAWPCTSHKHIDTSILSMVTERPNADNIQGELHHSLNPQPTPIAKDNTSIVSKEGFTNMGEHYVRPGDCPDGHYWCPQSNKCKQVCMNCKFNERTYGKSKEFNEYDPCSPDQGVYAGIDNQGNTLCTCGKNNKYCNELFDAQGGMLYNNNYIMNVGDFGLLGDLAAY